MAENRYQQQADRALQDAHAADAAAVAIYLVRALVYALRDVAAAIRERD